MPPLPSPDFSPLAAVERRVQERAAAIALDMDAGAADVLRRLIAEIDRWTLEHKRGLQPVPLADPALVAEQAYRNLAGYGPLNRCSPTTTSGRS